MCSWVHGVVSLMQRVGLGSMPLKVFSPCVPSKLGGLIILGGHLACASSTLIWRSGEHTGIQNVALYIVTLIPSRGWSHGKHCQQNLFAYIFSFADVYVFRDLPRLCSRVLFSGSICLFLKSGNPASTSLLLRLASSYVGSEYQIKTWAFQERISPPVLYICFNEFIK